MGRKPQATLKIPPDAPALLKKRKAVEAFFSVRWGLPPSYTSEFGAYCVQRWLEGRSLNTNFEWLSIDYLRKYGRRTTKRGSKDALNSLDIDDNALGRGVDAQVQPDHLIRSFEQSQLLRLPSLNLQERVVLLLTFKWGFNAMEIGDLLDCTPSRISQIKTAGQEKVKKFLKKK